MAERRRTVLIVGASAAGLRCACRLARLQPGWSIRVLEARAAFSVAACGLPYALSGDIADPLALRRTTYDIVRDADFFAATKGVEVLVGFRAIALDPANRLVRAIGPDGEVSFEADDVVLATGARPRRLPDQPDHSRVVSFHEWDDLKPLHQGLAQGKIGRVAIIGAGLVGCELAEAFAGMWGAEVALIEAADGPLPGILDAEVAAGVARHLRANDVELTLGSPVTRIDAGDDGVTVAVEGGAIEADVAVVAVGVEPAGELAAAAGLATTPGGALLVDDRLATSAPHVWAAGDCVAVPHAVLGDPCLFPLGSLANRQGRVLANVLAGGDDRFPPVAGATAVKVFDWNVAATGCTRARALAAGLDARTAWVTLDDRAHYWPEVKPLYVALVWEAGSRRLLGVQAVGEGEAAKRIDVATQHLVAGGTLQDVAHVEHAYAPPYAPAMEPLAVAAQVALNAEDGLEALPPDAEIPPDTRILDVRESHEVEARPAFPDRAFHVELGRLSNRLDEIDPETSLVVCERGTRSAEAARHLRKRGIRARYLGGGLSWRNAADENAADEKGTR